LDCFAYAGKHEGVDDKQRLSAIRTVGPSLEHIPAAVSKGIFLRASACAWWNRLGGCELSGRGLGTAGKSLTGAATASRVS